jgi:hypothetical protein
LGSRSQRADIQVNVLLDDATALSNLDPDEKFDVITTDPPYYHDVAYAENSEFYYVWLKVILNWPDSLLTWDILFMIPYPWVGPVLAPILVSIAMIFASVVIFYFDFIGKDIKPTKTDWLLEILAGIIIFISFIYQGDVVLNQGIPTSFPWGIFVVGLILGIGVFVKRFYLRSNL